MAIEPFMYHRGRQSAPLQMLVEGNSRYFSLLAAELTGVVVEQYLEVLPLPSPDILVQEVQTSQGDITVWTQSCDSHTLRYFFTFL